MIRPIGIQHTDLRHRRLPVLLFLKVIPDMEKILKGHGKRQAFIQRCQLCLLHFQEACKHRHIRRLLIGRNQSIRLIHADFSGIHRIDTVSFDLLEFLVGNIPFDQIGGGCPDHRLFLLIQKLKALHGRIRPLVELSRQKLHAKYSRPVPDFQIFPVKNIYRRLRKNHAHRSLKGFLRQVLHIITIEHAHPAHFRDPQITADFLLKLPCLYRVRDFLFYIDTSYLSHSKILVLRLPYLQFRYSAAVYCFTPGRPIQTVPFSSCLIPPGKVPA